jgi:hypothetical protein
VFFIAQWFFGLLFLFTLFNEWSVAMFTVPLWGLFAIRSLEPYFLVFYTAVSAYVLTIIPNLYSALGIVCPCCL